MQIPAGSQNQWVPIHARTAAGLELTGKVAADFALWYSRPGADDVSIPLTDMDALDDPWTEGEIKHVRGTEYRLAVPNAALATGAAFVTINGTVDGGLILAYSIGLDTSATPEGIYTQTVTVTSDGTTPIPNATVQIWSGDTLVSTKTTSALGIASPQSNAGTFTLKVLCAGYNDYNAALTVAGNATLATITLSSLGSSIPAETDPAKTTAYWYVYGNDTELVGLDEVSLTIEIAEEPADKGRAYDDTPRTRSSSALGVISASLFKGAKYKVILSDDREWVVEVPLTAGTTYRMPPIRVVST